MSGNGARAARLSGAIGHAYRGWPSSSLTSRFSTPRHAGLPSVRRTSAGGPDAATQAPDVGLRSAAGETGAPASTGVPAWRSFEDPASFGGAASEPASSSNTPSKSPPSTADDGVEHPMAAETSANAAK